MAEAQKMMADPKFQEQMKKVTESAGFKNHMQAQADAMKDPEKLKEMEEAMKKRVAEGNDQLEKFQEAQKKKLVELKAKEGKGEGEGEDDKKEAASEDDKKEEATGDDMPDIPNLSLN